MVTLLEKLPQPLQHLVPALEGGPEDLLISLYFGLTVLALRLAAEKTVLPAFKRLLKPYAAPDRLDKTAFKVFENAFTSTFCFTLAVWAWHVTLFDNGGCTPFSTKACLSTWPDVPLTRQFQLVWLSIGGYYTYEMIGTVLRVGCILNTDMVIHHVITMTMMVSYCCAGRVMFVVSIALGVQCTVFAQHQQQQQQVSTTSSHTESSNTEAVAMAMRWHTPIAACVRQCPQHSTLQ
jgi:hypothetical protein